MKITSDFAILDVKEGRHELFKALKKKKSFIVVITGDIDYVHSRDDGTSIEFAVLVDKVNLKEIKS